MALMYWWPFIEDGHNQGLKSSQPLSSLTFNNNGKFGKCLELTDNLNLGISPANNPEIDIYSQENAEISYAFWVKIDKQFVNNYIQNVFDKNHSYITNALISLNRSTSGIGLFIFCTISNATTISTDLETIPIVFGQRNGTNSSQNASSMGNITLDQWHHFVITYDKNNYVKIYLNGVLQKTISRDRGSLSYSSTLRLNNTQLYGGNTTTYQAISFKEYFNDVRIYNHALSAKEVAELAKGLVLHYHLDNNGLGRENLLSNSSGYEGIYSWSKNNSNASNLQLSYGNENGVPYLITKRLNDSSTTGFNIYKRIDTSAFSLQAGDKFTISGYYKVPSTEDYTVRGRMFIRFYNTGSSGDYANTTDIYTGTSVANTIKDKWIYFEQICTVPSTYIDGNIYFYLSYFSKGLSTVYWKQIKMEVGEHATPWCPAKEDALYNLIDDTKIYDCSGYCNNGTITGNLSAAAPSPRYNSATVFNGSSLIEADPLPAEASTLSAWIKWKTIPSGTGASSYVVPIHDKNSKLAIGITNGGTGLVSYIGSGNGGVGSYVNCSLQTNIWYHIVIVKTGDTTRNVYINGEQMTPKSSNTYWGGDLDKFTIGGRHAGGVYKDYINGEIVDVRAYVTAFSEEQVLDLYRTSMLIDANGNISPRGVS